ncbi:hypothetical protein TB1_017090 [Malus domestica]
MLIKKKLKTSFTAREGPSVVERPVIDITSSTGKKNEATRSEPVAFAMSRMVGVITDRIAQHRGPVMPLVPKFVPRCSLGAKSGSYLEKLAIMKSDKVDSTAKVVLRPTPSTTEIDSLAGKDETARVGNCEKSTKPASGEAVEICVLLKLDLLEDITACFFIFLKGLLAFTFEASIGEVVGKIGTQARAARGETLDSDAAKNVTAAEGVATE